MMRGDRRRSWLGAALLGLFVVTTTPACFPGLAPFGPLNADDIRRMQADVVQLSAQGRYDEAIAIAEDLDRIAESVLEPNHPAIGIYLGALAQLYKEKGDYARAEPLFLRSLSILENAGRASSPEFGDIMNNLAMLYHTRGDYARPEPLLLRSLSILERTRGPSHPDFAKALNNLAMLYYARGDYARAEPLFLRAIGTLERAQGPDSAAVASPLLNLALLYSIRGDHARAEPLFLRTLRIAESTMGPDSPTVAMALNNLGFLYEARGDYARAASSYERALRIWEKSLGPDHPNLALVLNNLALLYMKKGDYARAEPLYQHALRIWEKSVGPDHPDVATSLNNMAAREESIGDYARAEALYLRSLAIREKALGPDHPDVAVSLNNLALLYAKKGDYPRAEPLYKRSLQIMERALGPDHPDIDTPLSNLAQAYMAQGRIADAVQAQEQSTAIEDKNAALNLGTGSETQRRAYMATLVDKTAATISLHVRQAPSNARAARLALATIIHRKGRVLDAMADSFATLRRHLTPDDQALLDRFSSVTSQIGSQISRGPGKLSPEQYRNDIHTLEQERQRLEREIGKRSAAFRAEQQPVTLEQIQATIPEGAALVELFRYNPFDPNAKAPAAWGPPRYVAYVLRSTGDPTFADLGSALLIEAAAQNLREALADHDQTHDPRLAARSVDTLVMRPIRALLGDTSQVLLSPDAALNLVPFEALVDEQGRYLVERFAFTYLTSGRDLLRLEAHAAPKQGALVVADPDFGVFGASSAGAGEDSQRGLRSVDMTRARFTPLHGTAEEARAIAGKLPDARVLLQGDATEAAVKAVKAPRILHLATHGFFLPRELPDERRPGLDPTPAPSEIAAALQRENPLLRAGLALAGANTRVSGDKDDGILTALEVSGLNLDGTKLVVLSACQTGLGDAVSGEGVYGLRRALVMAGAETQVMSLWEVDSGHTRELMVAYYEKLKAGLGRGEALRQVKLAMLRNQKTAHPNLWASFIVSGDWRALDAAPVTPDLQVRPGPRGCACAQAGDGDGESWPGGALVLVALSAAVARRSGRRLLLRPGARGRHLGAHPREDPLREAHGQPGGDPLQDP